MCLPKEVMDNVIRVLGGDPEAEENPEADAQFERTRRAFASDTSADGGESYNRCCNSRSLYERGVRFDVDKADLVFP